MARQSVEPQPDVRQWEAGGAIFVEDVTPYERMKLMMLNGTHSMLAYSGFPTRKLTVRDIRQDVHLFSLYTETLAYRRS